MVYYKKNQARSIGSLWPKYNEMIKTIQYIKITLKQ